MKVLDRYLTRELFIPILYCAVSLIALVLIADLFDNLEDLLKHGTPLRLIFKYYLSLVPYVFTQTIPWAAWLGTLFLLVNLGFHNETMAMKAAGLKITNIVRPILFLGFLIGIVNFLVSDRVVPPTFRQAKGLRDVHIRKNDAKSASDQIYQNVTYYSAGDQLYFFRTFSNKKAEVEGAVALWLGRRPDSQKQKMVAKRGTWNGKAWKFEGVSEFQMDSRGRILGEPKNYPSKIYPEIVFTPQELASASTESMFLTYKELKHSIKKLRENGVSIRSEAVDLHYRLAAPWQGLVMMMIAIPFLARTTNRKEIALNVLFCIGIIFAFQVTSAIGLALGKAGKILPFLGAWTGNIIFGAGSLLKIDRANY